MTKERFVQELDGLLHESNLDYGELIEILRYKIERLEAAQQMFIGKIFYGTD